MKSPASFNTQPAAGEAAHTPKNPGAMNDADMPALIPVGFGQITGASYRQPGDIEWNPYRKIWREAYRADYCIGNTSIVARPSPEVALALLAIACSSHAALVEAMKSAADGLAAIPFIHRHDGIDKPLATLLAALKSATA